MTKNQQTLNTFYDGFGGGWRWAIRWSSETQLQRSTTTRSEPWLSIFSMRTARTLIWRGSSSDTLSDKSDKNIKNLDKGVQKMFDHFPPGAKK